MGLEFPDACLEWMHGAHFRASCACAAQDRPLRSCCGCGSCLWCSTHSGVSCRRGVEGLAPPSPILVRWGRACEEGHGALGTDSGRQRSVWVRSSVCELGFKTQVGRVRDQGAMAAGRVAQRAQEDIHRLLKVPPGQDPPHVKWVDPGPAAPLYSFAVGGTVWDRACGAVQAWATPPLSGGRCRFDGPWQHPRKRWIMLPNSQLADC